MQTAFPKAPKPAFDIPNFLYKIMLAIFVGILLFVIFVCNYSEIKLIFMSLIASAFAVIFARKFRTLFDKVSDLKLLFVLSILCFLVKFMWIYLVRVVPKVDYETFYYSGVGLSENWFYPNRYIALFPHIFGYSSFLSLFFAVFGESVFLATFLNVILSVISGIFIYKISRALVSPAAAVCAYGLWIVCPSQTIYNSLVLSDPLYTTFILAFVYFVVVIAKKEGYLSWQKMLLCGAVAAVLLQGINVSRPIAMILVIALFIWIFVLRFKELFKKAFLVKWLSFFAVMLAVYFSLGSLWNIYFTSRIGETPASTPGYNIYVGFNEASKGAWNAEDSALLYYYSDQEGATADWAQQQMMKEAEKRITSGGINFIKLFMNKLSVFLGKDSAAVGYSGDIFGASNYFRVVCNVFYYSMILLSICGAYKMLKISHRSAAFILPLFVIGITCAQMLVEVAPRYHYSIIPFLIMIPQFYLFKKNNKNKVEEKIV